jgi:hypothetical protein
MALKRSEEPRMENLKGFIMLHRVAIVLHPEVLVSWKSF